MSDAKSPPDLSMDEILATIRRIIAEDDRPGVAPAAAAGDTAGNGNAPPAAATPAPADQPPRQPEDDDVLELTEAVNADGSVRHLAPIGSSSRAAALMRPASPAEVEPEASPRAEAQPETHPITSAETAIAEGPVAEAVAMAAVEQAASEEAEPTTFQRAAEPATAPPHEAAEANAAAAGARTLEDIVCDLLRPMLQTWLDANLPALVERLARAEIARTRET